jgi:hypothetical protein
VKDQPEVVLYADCYALAYSSQFADFAAFGVFKWGLRGSQEEGALQPDALEGLTYYARFQRGDVGGDVWQFRHGYRLQLEAVIWQCVVEGGRRASLERTAQSLP